MAVASDGTRAAWYQYSGLGNRTGILEYAVDQPNLGNTPVLKDFRDAAPSKRTEYITDLTRPYHNLLQKVEMAEGKETIQSYTWDTNAVFLREGERVSTYLQDELGSPVRLVELRSGRQTLYGYDEFGGDLFGNQGETQPFGYTGYQPDRIAGTSYAQAREYLPWAGRFAGRDLIKGFAELPFTLNEYGYCWNNPIGYVDRDGQLPTAVAGGIIGGLSGLTLSATSDWLNGEEINWKRAWKNAALGAAAGVAVGSGAGFLIPIMGKGAFVSTISVGSIFGMTCNTLDGDFSFDNVWNGLTTGAINSAIVAMGVPYAEGLFEIGDVGGAIWSFMSSNFVAGAVSNLISNLSEMLDGNAVNNIIGRAVLSGTEQMIYSGFVGKFFSLGASEIVGDDICSRIARGVCNIVLAQFLCDFTLSTYVTSRTVNMIFFSEATT